VTERSFELECVADGRAARFRTRIVGIAAWRARHADAAYQRTLGPNEQSSADRTMFGFSNATCGLARLRGGGEFGGVGTEAELRLRPCRSSAR
jgi:hypothetical protein